MRSPKGHVDQDLVILKEHIGFVWWEEKGVGGVSDVHKVPEWKFASVAEMGLIRPDKFTKAHKGMEAS